VVSSLQHEDCQALVEAAIDAAGDTARIPPAAIERCFGSADELAAAAYSRAAQLLMSEMTEGLAESGPWLVRWERAVRAVVAAVRLRPGLAHLTLNESEAGSDEIRERRMLYRREFIDLLEAEYTRDRDPAEVPELHVELLAGAVYRAYVAEAVAGRLTDPRADVVPKLVNVIALLEPVPA
jgi:AcrR family transcriptional regulator